ncbi:protein N-lysine methyltransferase [Pseudoscourfieldia marina]
MSAHNINVPPCSPDAQIFLYSSWLAHQSYYDDYRHSRFHSIIYEFGGSSHTQGITIAQNKWLGKGGIVWDGAYILADHLITQKCTTPGTKVLELGAGTGLAGIALAAVGGCSITLTDRAEFVPLMIDNLERNQDAVKHAGGKVETPRTLEWSTDENVITPNMRGAFDVVLAADCVADIYDSSALLHTIHATLKPGGRAYILMRVRIPEHIEGVMEEASALFADAVVEDIKSVNRSSHHMLVKVVRTT